MNLERIPHALIGVGGLLGGVMLLEIGAMAVSSMQFETVAIVNWAASLPFIVALVGSGYWLRRQNIATERYRRIAGWTAAAFGFFFVFFTVIAVLTEDRTLFQIGIIRWGASAGAGVGALVGVLEARAIEREVAADRTRVRNEELQRQNERLEEFASIVSHDLRNPLSVASGYLELLREEYDDEALDRIDAAHERMDQIIEELLVLAESGQPVDDPQSVSLAAIVERCWSNVDTKGATLEIEGDATIRAYPDRIQHLFENLFRNSVEHASTSSRMESDDSVEHGSTNNRTQSGDSVEHSSTSSRAGPDDSIEHGGEAVTIRVGTLPDGFYVVDDGPGIPAGDRETVLESGYSTKQGGTGLGLAIAQRIADAHGWALDITEGSDGGMRLEITGVEFADR
ncbi:sensor histidine kinase [Haloplanus halobius]|uniref:sensor histidine kinase n=1 Tax=Haloplanus halobius TaxID=2934938 RepID=UPI00200F76A2|nr:HAMP domain-containing sensor histidine kinase [Haloplanus sp. XH21]